MAQQSKAYTEEEIKKYKELILESLKSGLPLRRMVAQFDVSMYYIKKFRNELIEEGAITKEEVEEAYNEYMKEHPAARGLDGSKTRKPRSNEKSKEREAKALENKEKVFVILKNGKSIAETAQELQMADTSVTRISKVLIEEGRLKESEIKKQTASERIGLAGREEEGFFEKRDKVVELLRLGLKPGSIRTRLNISSYEYALCRRDIRHKNLITSEEIQEARKNREQKDLEYVVDNIKKGYSLGEIKESNSDFVSNEVGKIAAKAIQLGLITRDQVEENRKSATKRAMNLNAKLSPEEQLQFIIDKVKKGYTPKEISESDKTKSISYHKALYQKRQIIANGIISQEDADKAMRERVEEQTLQRHNAIIDQIKSYTIQGYTLKEMSDKLPYAYSYLSKIRRDYEEINGWFSKEELKEFARQRKAREAKEKFDSLSDEEKARIENERVQEKLIKQQETEKRRQERKKETEQIHRKHIEQIKILRKERKICSQIAEELGVSQAYVNRLIRKSKDEGTWFTEEELQEIENEKIQERNEKNKDQQKRTRIELMEQTREKYKLHTEEIKALYKDGLTFPQIAEKIKVSISYISMLVRDSKHNGTWFTEEEIQEIKNNKKNTSKAKNHENKGITKDRRQEEKIIQRKRQTEQKHREQLEEIKRLRRERKTLKQISEKLGCSPSHITELIRKSKEEGTWDEDLQGNPKENKELFEKIKLHIGNGKTIVETAEILHKSYSWISKKIKKYKEKGMWFTPEELREIRENRHKSDEILASQIEEIKRLTNEGKIQAQIAKELGTGQSSVSRLIKKSKTNGTWFTKEEFEKHINAKKAEKGKKKKKENSEKGKRSAKNSDKKILEIKKLFADGKTQRQIAEKLGCSAAYVSMLIQKCKNNGTWFTDEELSNINLKGRKNKYVKTEINSELTAEDREIIEQMKSMIREHKTIKEICGSLGFSESKFNNFRKQAIVAGAWISNEEWNEINKQKVKQRHVAKAKVVKKQEELGTEKFIEEIIALKRLGKKTEEIATIMECSVAHIQKIRKQSIENGTWISEEEEKELKRKLRERQKQEAESNPKKSNKEEKEKEKEQKMLKKEEQERLKQEQALAEKLEHERTIYKNYEIIRDLEYVERKSTASHMAPFKFLRKAARQEDREEYNGEEDVSIKGRQAFFASMLKLHSLGWNEFTENDMQIITDSFYMHPELANKKIIKFVVANSAKKGGWNSALETVQELMDSLGETKFYDGLRNYSYWIKKQASIPKIKALKSQGLTNTQIGERLRMSSAEVAILLDNDKNEKDIDFELK